MRALAAIGAVLLSTTACVSHNGTLRADTIEARKLIIVDKEGRSRIEAEVNEHGRAFILISNEEGTVVRVGIQLDEANASVFINDENGEGRVMIHYGSVFGGKQSNLTVMDAEGIRCRLVALEDGTAGLILKGDKEEKILVGPRWPVKFSTKAAKK